ncbi:SEC14-like protein 2 [Trichonephila clavata]|uniref:SEC14-like protein 2 n=1 Tax=Trichonephila clavata TaxID=2740835 RepID=A0A8X6KF11_TRICU|nr:SEC14-like protein 2 [Trichonephila clavata]
MKDEVPQDMYEDKYVFYKFLKARNFNIKQAETMLKKNLIWRKELQIDTIVLDFKPYEVLQKYISQNYIGFDKSGCCIQYAAIGSLDGKGLFKSANQFDVLRCVLQEMEKINLRLKHQSEKSGKTVNQSIFIYNLENMTLAKATHRQSVELFVNGIQIFQDNYPEFLKTIYIINASVYFTIVFPIIKRILSGALLDKIIVYGKEGWKEVLLSVIDADVLPKFLGGNRADPDGNPLCNTFLVHAGMIPEKYYLTKDFSKIAEKEGASYITVEKQSKFQVPIYIQYADSILHWEYEVKVNDIGFGLIVETNSSDLPEKELIPVHKVLTELKSETGMYRCKEVGTYYIIFDNSYSWFSSKEIYYRTWVTYPFDTAFTKEDNFVIDF